jgi:hypothetical protein
VYDVYKEVLSKRILLHKVICILANYVSLCYLEIFISVLKQSGHGTYLQQVKGLKIDLE